MTKWRKGPPPSVGWWPASITRDSAAIRWWDGRFWSAAAFTDYTKLRAAVAASKIATAYEQEHIEWTDRPAHWPERSLT